ncbi:Quinate repressor protein [Fusarium oxysporum f. sp. cubense]|uniref:Quinate repressor protein n=1 Tax=Fusarium oxysporum f. sp. cubense TaxID=61366 RepID=A0A559LQH8_FUSOC|nr:Quinate repressor protein [Fusarium oxysporum f. sp. cubense]
MLFNKGPRFRDGASIALVGLPSAGKSTLGVIASTSLKMRLVETDRCFCTMTGSTAVEFLKKHGKEALQTRETEILQQILEKHASNTIIVVATRTTDIPACRGLLQRFSETHPVIHILRHQDQVAQHLQGRISRQDVQKIYDVAVPHYRSCANYEFFVSGSSPDYLTSRTASVPSFLSLKGVERDFLGFLRFIHGQQRHTGFLLPPEDTELSRILVVPFPPQGESLHLDQVHGVHAIQLRLSLPSTLNTDWSALLNHMSCISARVRSGCDYPLAFCISQAFDPLTGKLKHEARYFALLTHAISLGFEYCYLDLHAPRRNTVELVKRAATTRIIGTWHHYTKQTGSVPGDWWTSQDCISTYWMAVDLGCAVTQLSAGPARALEDDFSAIAFAQSLRQTVTRGPIRLSVFNSGDSGKLSRVLNRVLTPVVLSTDKSTRANPMGFIEDDPELDGIITLQQAQEMSSCTFISSSLRFCSFGSVIAHSIAPSVHNAAFAALGLLHRYGVTESDDLNQALAVMHASDFGGLACANPYKQMMISLLDEISDHARVINAVNTIYPRRTPSRDEPLLCGENTDWIGIVSCIKNSLSPINTVTLKTSALVIGAGGMASAAIYGLLHLGVTTIFIHNRTVERAECLARRFGHIAERLGEKLRSTDRMRPTEERHCRFTIIRSLNNAYTFDNEVCPPSIIINALPDGGKEPVSSALDLPLSWFSRPTGGVYIEVCHSTLG